jgi:hypothetical protein
MRQLEDYALRDTGSTDLKSAREQSKIITATSPEHALFAIKEFEAVLVKVDDVLGFQIDLQARGASAFVYRHLDGCLYIRRSLTSSPEQKELKIVYSRNKNDRPDAGLLSHSAKHHETYRNFFLYVYTENPLPWVNRTRDMPTELFQTPRWVLSDDKRWVVVCDLLTNIVENPDLSASADACMSNVHRPGCTFPARLDWLTALLWLSKNGLRHSKPSMRHVVFFKTENGVLRARLVDFRHLESGDNFVEWKAIMPQTKIFPPYSVTKFLLMNSKDVRTNLNSFKNTEVGDFHADLLSK